jgi:hypothetical protein
MLGTVVDSYALAKANEKLRKEWGVKRYADDDRIEALKMIGQLVFKELVSR